ncbi:MAG: alanine--tRNA ligase [Erysipelotrichaceae bacterium]|nr:alanine--tRNA ligase [Erysipelotrichaceae bacterium]
MKQLTGSEIRSMFLKYFESKGHMVEPGASLVPHNDPTLLWINAGVAALKKYFDGTEKPKCNRITNAQKSIRTNDIENVGKTARHHTFFEMLGNFSIGDYFKEEAIPFAWEFLTSPEWIGFEKDKMYITIYTDDDEAYRIWTEVCHVDPSHILRTDGNFWEIGEGPSGPDSEIFYDRGEKYDPEGLGERLFFEELENDRYIEVWNVVFSQYDAKEGVDRKDYKELPQKNIDTGMGLERLVSLVQGGETNFDTDLFLPIIHATEQFTDKKYEGENKMAYRVIADHIRTVTFAIADGAMFENTGRGYILRRVLRRAVRYGKKLDIKGAFMYRLVPVVADIMKDFYPYVVEKVELIQKLVKAEEESFHSTLQEGERILQDYLKKNTGNVLDGKDVFKLYDTYGFPVELTEEIALEHGISIDHEGFKQAMEEQRQRGRSARDAAQSMSSQSADLMNFVAESKFVGYDKTSCTGTVIGLFVDGVQVDELTNEGDVVLSETAFYAESGGQVADTGILECNGQTILVKDVKKAPHKQHLHHVVLEGTLRMFDEVVGTIDVDRREKIKANHSCLHLLQSALRKVIGTHVQQAGSYVCDEYARFDFTHFEKVSEQQLKEIEQMVNTFIYEHHDVVTQIMEVNEAKATGAMALFDEKYDDLVRVVQMGSASTELCGGTHVANTQQIGLFKIQSEESIGSGVRRITCKTGMLAYLDLLAKEDTLKDIASRLKMNSILHVEEKVQQTLDEWNAEKKENANLRQQLLMAKVSEMVNQAETVDDKQYLFVSLKDADSSSLKGMVEQLRDRLQNGFVYLTNQTEDKVVFVVGCSKAMIASGIKAGDVAKKAAQMAGGNGGGRPDIAQAGGKDITKLAEIEKTIRAMLGI